MTALALVGGTPNAGINLAGQTFWAPPAGGATNGSNTEAQAQHFSAAGTWSQLTLDVISNTTATCTATFRKNGVSGAGTVSVTSGATGFFTDATHSDATIEGDKVALQFVCAGTTLTFGPYSFQFDAGLANAVTYYGGGSLSSGLQTGNVFVSTSTSWNGLDSATEANTQAKVRTAGAFAHMSVFEVNGSQPYTFRLNGANGAQSVAGAAGLSQDAVNTDATVAGDLFCYHVPTTAADVVWTNLVRFNSGGPGADIFCGGGFSSMNAGTTYFSPVTGWMGAAITVEASAQIKTPFATKWSNLRLFQPNGTSAGCTVTFRVNGVSGAQALSVPFSSPGAYEDVTHSDTTAAGDKVCVQMAANTSSGWAPSMLGLTFQPASFNGNATGALGSTLTLHAMTGAAVGQANAVAHGALGSSLTLHAMSAIAVANAALKASKVITYAATGPPDASLIASKVNALAVTGPPDAQIIASKVVAYAVLGPPPRRPTSVRVPMHR